MRNLFCFMFSLILLIFWEIPSHAHLLSNFNNERIQMAQDRHKFSGTDHSSSFAEEDKITDHDLGNQHQDNSSTHTDHKCGVCSGCFAIVVEDSFKISTPPSSDLFLQFNSGYSFLFMSSPFHPPRA